MSAENAEGDFEHKTEEKKRLIADTFWNYFLKNGMVRTIINEVANELHISKKTVYKYFPNGKEEILYYIFQKIASDAIPKNLEELQSKQKARDKLLCVIDRVIELAVPYVLGNASQNEQEYLAENRVVGDAFLCVYREHIRNILEEGKNNGEFDLDDPEISISLIYGLILEAMVLVRRSIGNQQQILKIKNVLLNSVEKLVKK
jgi:AcrR family transcriptional regulator